MRDLRHLMLAVALLAPLVGIQAAEKSPLPIADLQHAEAVDFNREVLPFLSDNCLACHCQSTTKGGLNLETPELMLKGGETGPSIVPGKATESLSFQAAVHQDADLAMPPKDNKAKARDLTPGQLALLRLWIEQGAKPSPKVERVLQWQTLSTSLGAIFAAAVSPDGQFAACSRANQLFIYHLPSGQCVFNEPAHRDQINAIAFNPEGTLVATAGYREVKLWQRTRGTHLLDLPAAGQTIAVSPDGHWIAAAGLDNTIKFWAWPGNAAPRLLATGSTPFSALAFSPDGTTLVSTSDSSLSLWKIDSGEPGAKADLPAQILAVIWLPERKQIATAGVDGVVRLWSEELQPAGELLGHSGSVTGLAAAGPNRLLSGGVDGTARLWDLSKKEPVFQISHGTPITAVAARADGSCLASVGESGVLKLWDAAGKPISEQKGDRYVTEQAEACDRQLQVATGLLAWRKEELAAAGKVVPAAQESTKKAEEALAVKEKELEGKQAALGQAREEKKKAEEALTALESEIGEAGAALAALQKVAQDLETTDPPDAEKLAQARAAAATAQATLTEREGRRKPWNDKIAPAAKKVLEVEMAAVVGETARSDAAKAVAQAKAEVAQSSAAVTVAQAALEVAETVRQHAEGELQSARQTAAAAIKPIHAASFSPDGLTVATGGDDGFIHTWSATTGAAMDVLPGHGTPISCLSYTVRGELLCANGEGALLGWEPRPQWKLERTLGASEGESPFADRVNALAFSRDGKLLATGGGEPSRGGEIKLWEVATGQLSRDLPRLHTDSVLGFDFSPDGRLLASASADKLVRVTDLETGKVVRTLEGHTHHVLSLAWSLDGRSLASAGADNVVKVWNTLTGDCKKTVEGYEKEVTAVRFAGASETLLTSSGDSKVRLITTAGAEVRTLPAGTDYVECAAITADGKTALAGGQDGSLRIWNVADGKVLATFGK